MWVDPLKGNDITATLNDPSLPARTIARALNLICPESKADSRGIIHLNPGIYSQATNGEPFPVTMCDFVDIQGVGAKQVVLRGDNVPDTNLQFFFPVDDGSCTCGERRPAEVLVDYTFLTDVSYAEMLDAVTLQGSDIQVYGESELHPIAVRVSNCIFDLLNMPEYAGPEFGFMMVRSLTLRLKVTRT